MGRERRYQQEVLSALLKWTLVLGPLAGLLNLLKFVTNPDWTIPVGSAGIFLLALIAWRCLGLIRRGQIQRAARLYVISGMGIMALVVCIAARSEVMIGAMGLSVFVVIATFFEPPKQALRWGIASALLYEVALLARDLVPSLALRLPLDIFSLYTVPPVILLFLAFVGRITTQHLTGALSESEAAAGDLVRSYSEVEHQVAERTHDLVKERYRLNTALRELTEARDQAEAASRAKSAFLANMSHELRTPLTAILGYTTLVEHEVQLLDQPHIVADLSRIGAAGQHLLDLISDVLALAEIEAGTTQVILAPYDLAALITDVVADTRALVERNMNSLDVYYLHEPGIRFLDHTKVARILSNLLSNAAKFTKSGAITLVVDSEQVDSADWVTFRIADTGIGIAPEQIDQLFRPFTQGATAIEQMYGGTGLGLAICQRFCLLMGGEITATSEVAQGSIFTVRLPAAVALQERSLGTSAAHVSTAIAHNPRNGAAEQGR